jgi:N-acylneuraminate cytidylyltransferase
VVAQRCEKLHLPYKQGIDDKASVIKALISEYSVAPEQVAYIGNDVNDLGCFDMVGYTAAPSDAHETVRNRADLLLSHRGGHGAVREFCDRLLKEYL